MSEKWLAGIDIGGTSIKLAFFTETGELVHKWEIPTNKDNRGMAIISEVGDSVQSKLIELHGDVSPLVAAGVGAPGPVDTDKGLLFEAVNIGWQDNFPLRDLMQSALNVPVAIDNDANVAALGEMWKGAGKGSKDLICITLGTGVGGGIIYKGDIVHGSKGAAGEVGHITSVSNGGYMCNCGKTGCLETVASATGVVRTALDKLKVYDGESLLKPIVESSGTVTAKDVFDAAAKGDKLANEIVELLADYLGIALANSSAILNPEKIVIGGGVSKAGDILLTPLRAKYKKYAFKPIAENTEILLAELGNDAGIVGAAWLAANKIG
ncbi:ROK family glucokinase [Lederbergia lenta]|nr:ROK family glucokinase [Lederbergia lenta]MCM3111430.1 ROK family glucokinase [Lederbergia lenta]MEC2325184.1 ROK family glucokinase [Lederbergia lenta]